MNITFIMDELLPSLNYLMGHTIYILQIYILIYRSIINIMTSDLFFYYPIIHQKMVLMLMILMF